MSSPFAFETYLPQFLTPLYIYNWLKMNMIWYDCLLLEDFWSSAAFLTPVVPAECALQCTSFVSLRICLCVKLSLWERLKVQFLWEMHFSISKYKCSRRIIDSLTPRSDQQPAHRVSIDLCMRTDFNSHGPEQQHLEETDPNYKVKWSRDALNYFNM